MRAPCPQPSPVGDAVTIPAALFLALAALFPPCRTEDSALCHWRADVSGNGAGVSFIALSDSLVFYMGEP